MVDMSLAFRLPPELVARLDAYVDKLKSQNPAGLHVTRGDAARILLTKALDAEAEPGRPHGKKSARR